MTKKRRGTYCSSCCANSRSTRWPSKRWKCYIDPLPLAIKVPAEKYREMVIGIPLQYPPRNAGRARDRFRILVLTVVFIFALSSAAQQSGTARTNPRPASKLPSPFLEAETLLRQGSVEEAKQ